MSKKYIIANWKMNLPDCQTEEYLKRIQTIKNNHIIICPPFTLLNKMAITQVMVGGQDCHYENNGAFTGDISAAMLKDVGCKYVIVGHSERRKYHYETDYIVYKKAQAAINNALVPIICIGEDLEARSKGEHMLVIEKQLEQIINLQYDLLIAYEPLWAIGTGKSANVADIAEMHNFIKTLFNNVANNVKIVYGGSVNKNNYLKILDIDQVDGLLIGGASLKIDEFCEIATYN